VARRPELDMSNRLPVLAAEIRIAHAGVEAAAKTAAERAIEAGNALLEAKELVNHGEWLPWLKEHCELPERTAQFYMKIARLGLESATVAEIGLKAAAKTLCVIHDRTYDPFHHCDEDGKRAWHLFLLYFVRVHRWQAEHAAGHCEWLLQKQFKTPDEWLGEEGAAFRRPYNWQDPSEAFKRRWTRFQTKHLRASLAEIVAMLEQTA
jgi:hypothetical protein